MYMCVCVRKLSEAILISPFGDGLPQPSCSSLRQAASAHGWAKMAKLICVGVSLIGCLSLKEPYSSDKYQKMWYKNSNSVGIRRKFGDKKQIFSFGGLKCGKSREVLEAMGGQFLEALDDGDAEEMVAEVAKKLCKDD